MCRADIILNHWLCCLIVNSVFRFFLLLWCLVWSNNVSFRLSLAVLLVTASKFQFVQLFAKFIGSFLLSVSFLS